MYVRKGNTGIEQIDHFDARTSTGYPNTKNLLCICQFPMAVQIKWVINGNLKSYVFSGTRALMYTMHIYDGFYAHTCTRYHVPQTGIHIYF